MIVYLASLMFIVRF